MGLEPSEFPGGPKPHITLGYVDGGLNADKLDLKFRTGPMVLSRPRGLPTLEPILAKDKVMPQIPWVILNQDIRTGRAGQTYARALQDMGIDLQEFWTAPEHAIGRYDPNTGEVQVANGNPDMNMLTEWLQTILGKPQALQA
jgi:hypothetical protein